MTALLACTDCIAEPAAGWWPNAFLVTAGVLALVGLAAVVLARRSTGPRRTGWVLVAAALLIAPGATWAVARGGDRTIERPSSSAADGTVRYQCAAFAETGGPARSEPSVSDASTACGKANRYSRAVAMVVLAAGLTVAAAGALMAAGQLGTGTRKPKPRPRKHAGEAGAPA